MCKGLGSWWNLQAMNTAQTKTSLKELHLVKQGTVKGLLREQQTHQTPENNLEVAQCVPAQ